MSDDAIAIVTAWAIATIREVHPEYTWRVQLKALAVLAAFLVPKGFKRAFLALNICLCLYAVKETRMWFLLILATLPRRVDRPPTTWLALFNCVLTYWYLHNEDFAELRRECLVALFAATLTHEMNKDSWYDARFRSLCLLIVYDRFLRPLLRHW